MRHKGIFPHKRSGGNEIGGQNPSLFPHCADLILVISLAFCVKLYFYHSIKKDREDALSSDLRWGLTLTSLSPIHPAHHFCRRSYWLHITTTMTVLSTLRGGAGGGESDDDYRWTMGAPVRLSARPIPSRTRKWYHFYAAGTTTIWRRDPVKKSTSRTQQAKSFVVRMS